MKKFAKKDWPGLPKWPGIVTIGSPVSDEQAKEIIIRTDGLYFFTNDREFERQLHRIIGMEENDYEKREEINKKIDALDLEYLSNSQICSSYIGGAHGWCSWSGKILDFGRNIGKWPVCETVYDEWVKIAEAFPFLSLKSQLFNKEACQSLEHGFEPLIEYHIESGKVKVFKPEQPLDVDIDMAAIFTRGGERGCTIDQFKVAFELALSKSFKLKD